MGAVVEIWFESLIPFLLKDSHIVHCWAVHFKRGRHSLGHGFDLLVFVNLNVIRSWLQIFLFWRSCHVSLCTCNDRSHYFRHITARSP